ncbi:MAG: bifunctional riboflavin kinase/FAD synthetase [Oscillospiraceae bacterium]|nr:bifunctional riboflavin kinase/FAD synthetase [Oscillospiraceae bacterium]
MTDKRIFALGFFDGVHLGHQALLRACRELADRLGAETAAITFAAHPQSLFIQQVPPLINTLTDRQRLLLRYGMDHIYAFPVTKDVMSTDWRDFLDLLVEYGAAGFVCGDDFRFGSRGLGDGDKLKQYCEERGFPCVIVPEQTMDDTRVSSTYIRSQIEAGDMATAVRFLGHPHILTGEVVSGRHLGRTLGIPTANMTIPTGVVVPKFGVYVCRVEIDGVVYPAVANVGTRPTVGGHRVTVEPWILDFDGDLYGREITLEFHRFLRPERKFDSLEALRQEIRKNAEETKEFFGKT